MVLIEESCDGYATGYTGNYIKVYIPDEKEETAAGEFCDVVLTRTFRDGALAVLSQTRNGEHLE